MDQDPDPDPGGPKTSGSGAHWEIAAIGLEGGPGRLGPTGKICDTFLYVLCSFVTQIITKNYIYVILNSIFYHKK
jgi:hypothetical protein